MNRRHRRAYEQGRNKLNSAIQAQMAGKPWLLKGLTDACSDCGATGSMHGAGGRLVSHIYHDVGCPVIQGSVDWKPAR